MRTTLSLALLSLAACSSPGAPPKYPPQLDLGGPIAVGDLATVGRSDGSVPGDLATSGSPPPATGATTIHVHYPAGHTVTIRGSAAPLSWTTDAATTVSGTTSTFTTTQLTGTVEWKPYLDGTTWALGPNYHITAGQTVDVYPHFTTAKGTVETLIASFTSTVLAKDGTRPIYAYLPASYSENTTATYPVVYMHDGQNLWAAEPQLAAVTPWNVDTAFDNAAATGACAPAGASAATTGWAAQPLGGTAATCNGDGDCQTAFPGGTCQTFPEAIVIGIANTSARFYEYTPTSDPSEAMYDPEGGADLYIQMIINELKPQIDGMLRTRTDVASTAMAGSSLGGLVTAYAGTKRADVFGLLGVISPSTFWAANDGTPDVIVTDVKASPASPRPLKVYVDSGAGTADDESDTDMLATAYLGLGYTDGVNFRHVVQAGAQHSETYWSERFPGAMQLLLGVR